MQSGKHRAADFMITIRLEEDLFKSAGPAPEDLGEENPFLSPDDGFDDTPLAPATLSPPHPAAAAGPLQSEIEDLPAADAGIADQAQRSSECSSAAPRKRLNLCTPDYIHKTARVEAQHVTQHLKEQGVDFTAAGEVRTVGSVRNGFFFCNF